VSKPEPIQAERLTPEEAEQLRAVPLRTVRATNTDPVPVNEVQRAKVRGFVLGAALAAGAGVAAAVGYLFIRGVRTPQGKRRNHG
jgi:hypothetical protein